MNWSIGWLVAAEVVTVSTMKQLISPAFRQMVFTVHDLNCWLLALLACLALASLLRKPIAVGAGVAPHVARIVYAAALLAMIVHPLLALLEFTLPGRTTLQTLGFAGVASRFAGRGQIILTIHQRCGDLIIVLLAVRGAIAAAGHLRRGTPLIEWLAPIRSDDSLVNRVPVILQLALVFGAILALTTATGLHDARQFVKLSQERTKFSELTRLPANQMRDVWPDLQAMDVGPIAATASPQQLAAIDNLTARMRRIAPLATPQARAALAASLADLAQARQRPAEALPMASRDLKRALDMQTKVVERWGNDVQQVYARAHDLIILALAPTVALAGILAFLLARSILTAVARARAMVRSVAQSDDDREVQVQGRGEFAMLMRDIVQMRQLVRQREQASAARQLRQREELDELDRRQREAETAMQLEATARRQAEAISEAKSEFLANVSHEIRTPLNGVLGMAQAMAQEPLSAEQRERLEVVQASGETLLTLLNDLLDISKIEAGKLDMENQPFEPAITVSAACAAFRTMAEEKGLSFDLVLDEAIGLCRGDASRLGQVVANLASNAVKFTERGGITVEARRCDDEVTISVRDTGLGMPAASVERMFEKFVQADATTTRRFGGSGLGLAICRDIVGLMGGSIHGVSAPGEGSCFTVSLSLPCIAGEARGEAPEARVLQEGHGVRVLAAEDNAVNRLVLTTLLQQAGADITVVENGLQAVEAWAAEDWDLILMDVQMPVMGGAQATAEIRRREADGRRPRTPIIALTANAMAHQTADYLAAGMDCVVAKPIKVADLLSAMAGVLDASADRGKAARAV